MVVVTSMTQYKIIDAYFRVLQENPCLKKVTLGMVAEKAGMRRESIYRYHFQGVEDIQDRIHYLINLEIKESVQSFLLNDALDLDTFLNQSFLPILYAKKDWLKIMSKTTADTEWNKFLIEEYAPLIENYLDSIEKKEVIPNSFLALILIKEVLAITSTWLTDDEPEPVSLFTEKFISIIKKSPFDLLERPTKE